MEVRLDQAVATLFQMFPGSILGGFTNVDAASFHWFLPLPGRVSPATMEPGVLAYNHRSRYRGAITKLGPHQFALNDISGIQPEDACRTIEAFTG